MSSRTETTPALFFRRLEPSVAATRAAHLTRSIPEAAAALGDREPASRNASASSPVRSLPGRIELGPVP